VFGGSGDRIKMSLEIVLVHLGINNYAERALPL
jgi:hypothetical protein